MSYQNPSPKSPSRKRSSRLSTPVRLDAVAVAACFLAPPALANPVNPVVVNGAASFAQAGKVLTVTNSNGAIINWDKFSIKAGETTRFVQPAASSSVLNRVLNDPTTIYGTLSSNGRVWLVNPAGILVGPGGRIDTAAFVASTLAIRNEDFLAGRKLFANDGAAKDVINQGEIRTPAGGSVYLIGSNVSNEGIITTPKGETILAAGATVSLIDSATPGVKVEITGAEGNSTNLGAITAEAGRIGIAGVIVRNSGALNASSVVSEGGRVFLKASQDAYVDGNGRIVTTGTKGGSVEVLGNRVAVMDKAEIDASGANGGGRILVGGDYQGGNPDIQNASITYLGQDAVLKADATNHGDGGTAIVWADDTTRAYGSISARGGAAGGNGGFVETSGKRYLDVKGIGVSTAAPRGSSGTWLLDPTDVIVVHSGSAGSAVFYGGVFDNGGAVSATLSDFDINTNLAGGSITISTSSGYGGPAGDILFDGAAGAGGAIIITNSAAAARTLTLNADNDIKFVGGTTTFTAAAGGSLGIVFNPGAGHKVEVQSGVTATFSDSPAGAVAAVLGQAAGQYWDNSGTVNLNGLSHIALYGGAVSTFNNLSGGVLNINSAAQWSFLSRSDLQDAPVNNAGIINVNGTFGASTNYTAWEAQYSQAAGGSLIIGAAKVLSMQNMDTIDGAVFIGGAGSLRLSETHAGARTFNNTAITGPGSIDTLDGVTTFNNVTMTNGSLVNSVGNLTVPSGIVGYSGSASFNAYGGLTLSSDITVPGDLTLTAASIAITHATVSSGGASQTVTTTGAITLTGTAAAKALLEYTGSGTQSVYGGSITLQGDTSGGNLHQAHISSTNAASSQLVEATAGGISLLAGGVGGAGTNNFAAISSQGSQCIDATGALLLVGGPGADQNWAYLYSAGAQNVKVASITLTAGTAGDRAGTYIRGDGDQQLEATAGSITLTAAAAGTHFGGYATLVHGLTAGNQSINIYGGGLNVYGGGGTGLAFGADTIPLINGNCSGDASCIAIGVSANYAGINNRAGTTTLNMHGGDILLQGGSGAGSTANQGYYFNGAATALTILNAHDIVVKGGTSGGDGYETGDGRHYLINYAGIQSEGSLSVDANSMVLQGQGATYGGAFIASPAVDIRTTGDLALIGGAASNVTGALDPENAHSFIWQNPAVIGWGTGAAAVTLDVGGNLTLNGGVLDSNFGSPAIIGGFGVPATVDIAANSVSLTSANQFSDRIGSTQGGHVDVNSVGNIALGKGLVGTNRAVAGGWVDLTSQTGTVTQSTLSRISTPDLTVSAYGGAAGVGIDLDSPLNRVGLLDAAITGPGNHYIAFASDSVTLFNVDTTYGGGNGDVYITTEFGIYETDPGNTDIRAGSGYIDLYSIRGGQSGGLAISADVNTSGTVWAQVGGDLAATYGGIRIQANGQMPNWVYLLDYAAFNPSMDFYYPGGAISSPGNLYLFSAAPAQVRVRAGGDISGVELLNVGDGGEGFAVPSSLTVEAGTNLTVGGALAYNSDIGLFAGNQLLVTNTGGVLGRNVTLVAPTINLYGGVIALGGSNTPVTITGHGAPLTYAGIGFIADNLNLDGATAYLETFDSTADISGLATNSITLKNGAHFIAGRDIDLTLSGAASTLNLSDGSFLLANSPDTIIVDFPARTSGGIFINGVETTTNDARDNTGFFTVSRPGGAAVVGNGLSLSYAAPPPPPPPPPPAAPSLADCIANPGLAGCAAVLPTVAVCTAAPATPGCSVVLPTLAVCTTAPATPGCSAVLPTLDACTTAPATPGCSAVLPTLDACTAAPATPGCSVVLPTLAACTVTPTLPGCSAVLPPPPPPPPPATPPTLAECIANPSLAGCSAVLPSLASCTADATQPGCSIVLALVSDGTTNNINNSIINQLVNLTDGANNPANDNTPPPPPPPNAGNGALSGNQSVGGGDGAFGSESGDTGDKKDDKKDEKKSDQTTADGKKDDKPAHKKVAQCS